MKWPIVITQRLEGLESARQREANACHARTNQMNSSFTGEADILHAEQLLGSSASIIYGSAAYVTTSLVAK